MKLNRELPWNSLWGAIIVGMTLLCFAPRCLANIYATDIRINDDFTNIVINAGDTVGINYILNEPATLGATVQIFSGATVVRTLTFQPDTQGALRGVNSVSWDGLDQTGHSPPGGTYSISVTASTAGYTNWTQITSDVSDANTYVFDGHGISVDRNPRSPFYGRVFIANSSVGISPGTTPGDTLGILKFNADTSNVAEGDSSADHDGHAWADGGVSPWKLNVSADDFVYVDDLANGGEIYRWDPTISSNSLLYVLRRDNQPPGVALSGPAILGTGTNTQIWLADTNTGKVLRWLVTANLVCATNDTGKVVVTSSASNLFDVALDHSGNIYTCAFLPEGGDPSPRVFRYPAYDPSTNGNLPESTPDWAVGGGDDTYAGASGISVDPTGTYVAVAFGTTFLGTTNGNTKVLWATNGDVAANLDLGLALQGDANHDDTACGWDAMGNVYFIDNYLSRWRIFSPPGTNQATTLALATIQLSGSAPPPASTNLEILRISVGGGNVEIDFAAGTNDTVGLFSVVGSASVSGPYTLITGASITQTGPGQFRAIFPLGPATQYFRIARQGTTPPPPSGPEFTNVAFSGTNIVLTFSGNASDSASAFTILSAAWVNGSYSAATNASVTATSPGAFQALLPTNGLAQFYRVRK